MIKYKSLIIPSSTKAFLKTSLIIVQVIFMSACANNSNNPVSPFQQSPDPFQQNNKLGKGINLGNALEAPNEGDWGFFLEEKYFDIISSAGFNSVRVPIRWSTHALNTAPFTIEESFLNRIEWVIKNSIDNNLAVIINFHHYDELMENPIEQKERFIAIWKQISNHFKNYSNDLFFEILNEPHNNLTNDIWNDIIEEIIPKIRVSNPNRTLLLGSANWGGISDLQNLRLPENENNVIITFHYYSPFQFTHQGAEWVTGSDDWLGTQWLNSINEQIAIKNDFNLAINWAQLNNVPLNLGEFGAYYKADLDSRVLWTNFVSQLAVANNISFHYWEFAAGFGIYDRKTQSWNERLLSALFPSF